MTAYQNISLIGEGTFGQVHSCRREPGGPVLAKKTLRVGANETAAERFKQEVRILSKLDHPKIITVVDSQLAKPPLWYVMPHYRSNLRDEVPKILGKPTRVRKIFSAILDAVEYAHKEGVIHRDLKSKNVLWNSDDDVAVTDFGIGRFLADGPERRTQTGALLGTEAYMAPEQYSDAKNADHRCDVYALGRILYELHTERLDSPLTDFSRLSPEIADIVERCTKHAPEERFGSVTDLKDAWRAVAEASTADQEIAQARKWIARLTTSPNDQQAAERLLAVLSKQEEQTDLIRDAFVQVPTPAVSLMLPMDRQALKSLIRQFAEHIVAQPWGSTYVDKVATKCGNLYFALSDAAIRSDLLYCVVRLAGKHESFRLSEVLAELLEADRDPVEEQAVIDRLKAVPQAERHAASRRLSLEQVDQKLVAALRA